MRELIKVKSIRKKDLQSVIEDFELLVNLISANLDKGYFDFSGIDWITPQKSVYLTSILHHNVEELCNLKTRNSYLERIMFPYGLFINKEEKLDKLFDSYSKKNYLPILKLKVDTSSANNELRNYVISKFINHLSVQLQLKSNYTTGIRYIISELFDNIFEHSESEFVFLTFQNYPVLKKLEICIADKGIGVLETYKKNIKNLERDFSNINSHTEALYSAFAGVSTKSIERGFGIHTSRNMISEGFKGYALYQSGNALAINDTIVESNCYISGVIFAMIIPYDNTNENFSIYNYLE